MTLLTPRPVPMPSSMPSRRRLAAAARLLPLLTTAACASHAPMAVSAAPSSGAPGPDFVALVELPAEQRVDVLVGGRPFTSYIYPAVLKKPVLFPLRTATGTVVTRGYPLAPRPGERIDHPHHAGLWFNYGNVNGFDFWNNSTAIAPADAGRMGTIVHRSVDGVRSGEGEGTLDVISEWVDGTGRPLLRENTRFVFRAGPNLRTIDRVTTLTALRDTVRFTDDKEGLIGMRVARELEHPSTAPAKFTDASGRATIVAALDTTIASGHYRSSEGKEGDAVWGTRGRWATLSGVIGDAPVRIAMFDHPANPGYPTYWHARGYGLFAANPLGQKIFSEGRETLGFRIAPGQSVTFRHEVAIMSGPAATQAIEPYYASFAH